MVTVIIFGGKSMKYSNDIKLIAEDFFGCAIVLIAVGMAFAMVENYLNIEWSTSQFVIMCTVQAFVYAVVKHVFDRVYRSK